MRKVNVTLLTLLAIYLLAVPLAFAQGTYGAP